MKPVLLPLGFYMYVLHKVIDNDQLLISYPKTKLER